MQHTNNISPLFDRYLKNEASAAEIRQLLNYFNKGNDEQLLREKILQQLEMTVEPNIGWQSKIDAAYINIKSRMRVRTMNWLRYAAAIIILAGLGSYLWLAQTRLPLSGEDKRGVEKTVAGKATMANSNKAILILASGKKIELDGNQLSYTKIPLFEKEGAHFDPREAGQNAGVARSNYNTITTPRGSQYQVTLPDGTKAWLNAASSIKFPSAFTGRERRVAVTGEIYFEVAVNKMAPFVVSSKGMEVQVLGTSFNISAYEDENAVKTSLVEGSVKVNNELLTPGQAYLNGKVITTDINQDIAWKNGIFNFNHLPLKAAMNQLARWYNVEIVYEGDLPPYDFYGEMGRDLSLEDVLNGLSGLGGVNFKIEGKKVIVSNK